MKPWQLISWLVAATVIADVVALGVMDGFEVPAAALMVAQVSVLAIWLALGKTYWLVRVGMLTVVLFTWAVAYVRNDTAPMATILAIFASGVLCLGVLARLRGIVWTTKSDDATRSIRPDNEARQFSLARLMGWMTVIAIFAAVSRYADMHQLDNEILVMVSLTMITILSAAWIASLRGNILPRAAVVMVVASVVGIMFSRSSASSISMDESIAFYGIQALFVFAWVAALRTVGITIHRVKGPRSTTPDAPADEVTPSEQQ